MSLDSRLLAPSCVVDGHLGPTPGQTSPRVTQVCPFPTSDTHGLQRLSSRKFEPLMRSSWPIAIGMGLNLIVAWVCLVQSSARAAKRRHMCRRRHCRRPLLRELDGQWPPNGLRQHRWLRRSPWATATAWVVATAWVAAVQWFATSPWIVSIPHVAATRTSGDTTKICILRVVARLGLACFRGHVGCRSLELRLR